MPLGMSPFEQWKAQERNRLMREYSHKYREETPGYQQYVNKMLTPQQNTDYLANSGIPVVSDAAGIASDIKMFQEQPESRTVGNMLLSAAGLLPFVPSAFGTMIGVGAKNFPHGKLKIAEKMESGGAGRDEIYQQTQLWRGADKKWRSEIDDSQAKLKFGGLNDSEYYGTLGNYISHPSGLYDEYPRRLDDIYVNSSPRMSGAAYEDVIGDEMMDMPGLARNDEKLSAAMHETQHAIQGREGFARGGSPEDAYNALDASEKYELYRRLAGEVEARNVQKRLDMPLWQRSMIPPWMTEDVPLQDQIVRMGNGGASQSAGKTYRGYHGTDAAPFDEFRTGNAQGWGEGIYFSDNPAQANEFGKRLVEADVTLNKPFRDDWNKIYDEIEKTDAYKQRNALSHKLYGEDFDIEGAISEDGDFVNAVLRELGFDGVITPGSNNIIGDEIVAFYPESVKIRPSGASMKRTSKLQRERQEAMDIAQQNAAKPVSEGGLGLPAGNTAMDRARVMGFDTNQMMYHGTDKEFSGFSGAAPKQTPYAFGHHLTSRPIEASAYTQANLDPANPEYLDRGRVIPVYTRSENPLIRETEMPAASMDADLNKADIMRDLVEGKRAGNPFDSVEIRRILGDPEYDHINRVILNDTGIRSPNAAFDPMRAHEADLLAVRLLRQQGIV